MTAPVAIVHDYLTQRGGAERVVLALSAAFPGSPIHTSLFHPEGTFPEFQRLDVCPMWPNRVAAFRRNHRLALPVLAAAFSGHRVDADVVVCSSSGWAHGVQATGRKIVYCHTPARWLYQAATYVNEFGWGANAALTALGTPLRRWDLAAARTVDLFIANSTVVARRISETYGRESVVVHPPPALVPGGTCSPLESLEPGFFLCVGRLLPYKNVAAVVEAFRGLGERLVVAGTGPQEGALRDAAPSNVIFVGSVSDSQLRWLYSSCKAVVAASYEDFGLTPLEAAAFGKPAAVLRWGGFLDTVVEGMTGVFFDQPSPILIRAAVNRILSEAWEEETLVGHASTFSQESFIVRMRSLVAATNST